MAETWTVRLRQKVLPTKKSSAGKATCYIQGQKSLKKPTVRNPVEGFSEINKHDVHEAPVGFGKSLARASQK